MPRETKLERQLRQSVEEATFINVLKRAGNIIEPEVLVPNSDGRKWRVDYLMSSSEPIDTYRFVQRWIAIEIQGWGFGHVGRAGWLRDIAKCQAIAANRWLYVPVTREDVADGQALEALARCGVRVEGLSGELWSVQVEEDRPCKID